MNSKRHDRRQHRSDIGLAKGEQERGRVRLQAAEVFLKTDGALAFHHQIRGHRVEDADGQDGDIGCPRDGTRWVLGLLAVNGGGLKSDERREVEQQCDRDRAAGKGGPGEWRGVQRGSAALTALDQDRRVEDEDDQELEADQDREHLDRKIDLAVAQHRDDRHGNECVDPPREIDAEIVAEESRGGSGEQAIQTDLHGVVAEQGDHRGGAACGLPQAAGHKAVEGPGAGVMPRHGGIADSEDQQESGSRSHTREEFRGRCPAAWRPGRRRPWRSAELPPRSRRRRPRTPPGGRVAAAENRVVQCRP